MLLLAPGPFRQLDGENGHAGSEGASADSRPKVGPVEPCDPPPAGDKKDGRYDRVMVWTGGGLETAMFLGEYDAAVEAGWKPDLIVATCGSSLAANLIHAMTNRPPGTRGPKRGKDFICSAELYSLLALTKVDTWGQGTAANLRGKMSPFLSQRLFGTTRTVPDLWADPVMHIPTDFQDPKNLNAVPKLLHGHGFKDGGVRVVYPAGRPLYGKDQVGKPVGDELLFREAFFTDSRTAGMLEGFESPVSQGKVGSSIDRRTEPMVGYSLIEGSRAAISDIGYINAGMIDGKPFAGSAVDLYPIELARHLGKEVMMTYSMPVHPFVDVGVQGTFGSDPAVLGQQYTYSAKDRSIVVAKQTAEYWVDNSDISEVYDTIGYEPYIDPVGVTGRDFPAVRDRLPRQSWLHPGDESYMQEFCKRNQQLYELGKARVREALRNKCSKAHIRQPYHDEKLEPGWITRPFDPTRVPKKVLDFVTPTLRSR